MASRIRVHGARCRRLIKVMLANLSLRGHAIMVCVCAPAVVA
jgi:hypothetical protein